MSEIGCAKCGRPMPAERADLGLSSCKECTPQGKPLGVMVYSHKTAGVLEMVTDQTLFRKLKGSADDAVDAL